ncbi:hypothetical protein DXG01_012070 [Tephrocybe rancida]|nr:hypothetical protein DXG01_012070 [Tephrocybe rancida]
MDIVLQLKFEQHDDLRAELLGTGHADLFEDSDKDAFWGVGADWTGRNELGKALERLRSKLRSPTPNGAARMSVLHPSVHSPRPEHKALPHKVDPPLLRITHSPITNTQLMPIHLTPPLILLSPTRSQSTIHSAHTSEHDTRSPGPDLQPPSYSSIEDQTTHALLLNDKCRLPDCEKPVYYDGKVKSDYCSQQHRQYVALVLSPTSCSLTSSEKQSPADLRRPVSNV